MFAILMLGFKVCQPSFDLHVQVSCGEAFSVALDEDGFIYTTGSSEFGQLGNGETGERIMTANKITFDNCNVFEKRISFMYVPGEKTYGGSNKGEVVEIQEDIRIGHIACGRYHCLAMEAPASEHPPRVFSWGCGNYGCLGHGVQADEYKPRLIASLSAGNAWDANPVVSCAAGTSCSMVLTQTGHVYYWGKHRSVGEAVMRPQLLAELANNSHVADHVASGNQTVVICTRNAVTVAWGMGPHGELGFGDKKSSARPDFVSTLDKCRIQDMACGYGTTYYVIKQEDKDDEAAIKSLPVVSDEAFIELENFMETVVASKKK
jgi:alpha-tubulin suppressor-like RCC1 family protein